MAIYAQEDLARLSAGDCVAIVFASGLRKAVSIDSASESGVECWGARFRPPDYGWSDPITGETLHLAMATDAERRDLWRRVVRSRIVQFDWATSDTLSDSQLERILAILNERD
jgi:hypothetical protein